MRTEQAPADIREMYVVHTALRREYRLLRDMFGNMPPEIATVLPEISPPAYQDYHRKIHGTPTPR